MENEQWFYSKGDQSIGPVDLGELKDLIRRSKIRNSEKVWTPGMEGWKTISEMDEFLEEKEVHSEGTFLDILDLDQPEVESVGQGRFLTYAGKVFSLQNKLKSDFQKTRERWEKILGPPGTLRWSALLSGFHAVNLTFLAMFASLLVFGLKGFPLSADTWSSIAVFFWICLVVFGENKSYKLEALANPLTVFLGAEKSFRRRLIMTILFCLPWIGCHSPESFQALPLDERSVATQKWIGSLAFVMFVGFFLTGFGFFWFKVGRRGVGVLAGARDHLETVWTEALRHIDGRGVSGLEMEEVKVVERGIESAPLFNIDARIRRRIRITLGRFRVLIRIDAYGQDLFLRWEAYCDFSGRKLWMLWQVLNWWVNHLTDRWAGVSFAQLFNRVKAIVVNRSDTELEQVDFVNGLALPSSLVDDLDALQVLVHNALEKAAIEVLKRTGQKDRNVMKLIGREDMPQRLAA